MQPAAAFGAAISTHPTASFAVGEVVGAVLEAVGPSPDLALVFVSGHSPETVSDIADAIRSLLTPRVVVGATAAAVIGRDIEAEDGPAISLWAGRVGEVEAVRLETHRSSHGTTLAGLPDHVGVGSRSLIVLSDPDTFPVDALTRAINDRYPDLRLVGGVASAAGAPGSNRLILGERVYADGAVGVLLPEGLGEVAAVSQGCRPVGDAHIVTAASGNVIETLAMRPALERLRELVEQSDEEERSRLSTGLHLGVAVDERISEFGRGDFLIRAILGTEPDGGGLRIGDRAVVGTTVQFQVRDAATATEDLELLLATVDADAALVFSCNGRGERFFNEPNHDASRIAEAVSRGPVAGMFCAGELGPVGGRNHVHGLTVSILFLFG